MSRRRVFLAGAAGAVGRRLVPLLLDAGHEVWGTTRSGSRAVALRSAGVVPVVTDVFDAAALTRAMREARPEVVIHQLTDLSKVVSGPPSEEILKANARVREQGARNLVEGAIAAGARRFIAQSVAWLYAPGDEPHGEDDPLDRDAAGTSAISVAGVVALERTTLGSRPLEGVVLRYGQLYGPGTWNTAQNGRVPVHVDAAAHAALLATVSPLTGVFNIAEERGLVSTARARHQLGWSATFRLIGAGDA